MTSATIAKPKTTPAAGLPKAYPIHPQIVIRDRGLIFCCNNFIIRLYHSSSNSLPHLSPLHHRSYNSSLVFRISLRSTFLEVDVHPDKNIKMKSNKMFFILISSNLFLQASIHSQVLSTVSLALRYSFLLHNLLYGTDKHYRYYQ